MVCPESCTDLTDERSVRVIAGELGSRPRVCEEICTFERGVKSLQEKEAKKRAATLVNAIASSDFQPKGDWEGRAGHATAKATDRILGPERILDIPGVEAAARFERAVRNRRDPTRQPSQAKTGRIRRNAESARRWEEVRGAGSTGEDVETRWREAALLQSGL